MYAHYVLYDFSNNTAKNFESIRWKKNKIRFRWITVYIHVITDPVLKSITTRYRGNSILASKAVIDFCLISNRNLSLTRIHKIEIKTAPRNLLASPCLIVSKACKDRRVRSLRNHGNEYRFVLTWKFII